MPATNLLQDVGLGEAFNESSIPIVLPQRQPRNPDGDVSIQKLKGFARFIQRHASPRHQRVTAGGRIVPAQPNAPPPTFHMTFINEFLKDAENPAKLQRIPSSGSTQIMQYQDDVYDNISHPQYGLEQSDLQNRIHPDLKIPPGFQIKEVADSEGKSVVVCSNSTTMLFSLTNKGQTRCEILKFPNEPPPTPSPVSGPSQIATNLNAKNLMHSGKHSLRKNHPFTSDGAELSQSHHSVPTRRMPSLPYAAPQVHSVDRKVLRDESQDIAQHRQAQQLPIVQPEESYSNNIQRQQELYQHNIQLQYTNTKYQLIEITAALESKQNQLKGIERVLCFTDIISSKEIERLGKDKRSLVVLVDKLRKQKEMLLEVATGYEQLLPAFNSQTGSQGSTAKHNTSARSNTSLVLSKKKLPHNPRIESSVLEAKNKSLSPFAATFIPKSQTQDDHAFTITRGIRHEKRSTGRKTKEAREKSNSRASGRSSHASMSWARSAEESVDEYRNRCAEQRDILAAGDYATPRSSLDENAPFAASSHIRTRSLGGYKSPSSSTAFLYDAAPGVVTRQSTSAIDSLRATTKVSDNSSPVNIRGGRRNKLYSTMPNTPSPRRPVFQIFQQGSNATKSAVGQAPSTSNFQRLH
jgi:hypothetical protein